MKKQQIKKKAKTEKPKPQEAPLPNDEKPFDFGGLPIIDIKRILVADKLLHPKFRLA